MRKRNWTLRALVLVVFASFVGPIYSQTQQGDILGTVRDSQANVVPEATVRIINEATQAVRELTTDSRGDYFGLGFFVGTYRVEVDKPGFQREIVPDIHVDPQVKLRVDVSLKVGTTKSQITVTGEAPVITTQGATVNTNLPRAIMEKPLDTASRSGWLYDSLMWTPGSAAGNNAYMLWGGVGGSQVEVQVEGQQMYLEAEQAPEATDELSVVMGTPPAEYGRSVEMNVTMRSGSDRLHGAYNEELYNPAVNAVNTIASVNKRPTGISQWRRDISVGGPVFLPKIYDGRKHKTYFFFDAWSAPSNSSSLMTISVPSPSLLTGDFSQYTQPNGSLIPITDPQTGQQFQYNGKLNVIPPNRLSASSLAIQKDLYENNWGHPFTYTGNPNTNIDNALGPYQSSETQTSYVAKIDQSIGNKNVLSYSMALTRTNYFGSNLCGACYSGARILRQGPNLEEPWPQDRYSLGWTYTPTPHLVNQVRFGVTRYTAETTPQLNFEGAPMLGSTMLGRWNIQGIDPEGQYGYPTVTIDNWLFSSGNNGSSLFDTRWQGYENLTYILGRHTLKGGFSFVKSEYDTTSNPGVGSFEFTGQFTGDAFSDFLLGLPTNFSRATRRPTIAERIMEYAGYGQDDFRMTPKLTWSFGVRYDHYTSPYDKNGMYYDFDPPSGKIVVPNQFALNRISPLWPVATLPVVLGNSLGYPSKLLYPNTRVLPRVGFAYRPTSSNSFVIRGGFGIYNGLYRFGGLQTSGPFAVGEAYVNSAAAMDSFPDPFPSAAVGSTTGVVTGNSVDKHFRPDYLMSWNLSVEKEFVPGWSWRITYTGNEDAQLAEEYNINTPLLSTLPFSQSRRPYPNYQNIERIDNGATSHYNDVQFVLHRPMRGGALIEMSYTIQRGVDDQGGGGYGTNGQVQNGTSAYTTIDYAYDRARDRARETNWPTGDFVLNYLYELPFGTNKHWLSNTSGNRAKWALARVVGNWSTSGYFTWHTGDFYNVTYSGYDPGNIDQFTGRPDIVPGCKVYTGLPHSTSNSYFNENCFSAPAQGTLGNAPLMYLEGPSMSVLTLNPYKEFHIPHWERAKLTVGAWIYNILNDGAYWGYSSGNIGSFTYNATAGTTAYTPNPSGAFLSPWYVRRDSEGAFSREFTFKAKIQF